MEDLTKKLEGQGKTRVFQGLFRTFVGVFSCLFCLFYVYTATFGVFSVVYHNAVFIGAISVLVFLLYPARRSPQGHAPVSSTSC